MPSLISTLDEQFLAVDRSSRKLLEKLTGESLFASPRKTTSTIDLLSCGECIVRSAAMVEQTFGGITTRLWDDPFEWTLPEKLATIAGVAEYLDEVEATRQKGFELLTTDDDLNREFPAPVKMTSLFELLTQTLARANHYQGRAFAVFQMMTGEKPPRL